MINQNPYVIVKEQVIKPFAILGNPCYIKAAEGYQKTLPQSEPLR
jgi:hypothetical protein